MTMEDVIAADNRREALCSRYGFGIKTSLQTDLKMSVVCTTGKIS